MFGGSVPKNFFPAVEKGVRLAAEKGVLAGYPVVGLKATLLDGSYHPVDSSEMAFIMAAKLAYKAAMPEAGPVILEPIHTLKAHVPNDNTGDIMGDVTKRRGRVLGMEPDEDGLQTIIAEVPLAELANLPPSSGRPPRPRLVHHRVCPLRGSARDAGACRCGAGQEAGQSGRERRRLNGKRQLPQSAAQTAPLTEGAGRTVRS